MPLLASFAFANLKHDFGLLWQWLCHRSFWQLASMALAAFALVQHFQLAGERRHSAKVEAARHADREIYTKAQADAQAKNLADVARDKAERERITNAVSQNYEAELASVRADLARRLRQSPAKGAPGQPGLPGVSQAPSGVDGGARVSIPTDLYVRGAELEVQLDQLQRWVEQQSQVKH